MSNPYIKSVVGFFYDERAKQHFVDYANESSGYLYSEMIWYVPHMQIKTIQIVYIYFQGRLPSKVDNKYSLTKKANCKIL